MSITVKALVLTFKEFLTVWINQILYYNKIYDIEIYDQSRAFDILVYHNRNPQLQTYINELINKLLNNINNTLQLTLIIYNVKSQKPLRNYIINFHDLLINFHDLIIMHDNFNNDDIKDDNSTIINDPQLSWKDIYLQFNTLLYHHINELKRNQIVTPDNELFFKVIVNVPDSLNLVNSNWVRLSQSDNNTNNNNTNNNAIIKFKPIGQINLYIFNFDIHNEYM
ncbi:DNA-binding protein [Scheffersomyces amazonensis]|uniref:DNA-binding protein n=1 Tax=Scheffersomyces amazonensis TaxID=1078765 RepID=UPI00315C8717